MKKFQSKPGILKFQKINIAKLNTIYAGNDPSGFTGCIADETNQNTCPSYQCTNTESCQSCPPDTTSNTTVDRPLTQNGSCFPVCPG